MLINVDNYTVVSFGPLIWLEKRCSKSAVIQQNSTDAFYYLYHSTCWCLLHKITILEIICYKSVEIITTFPTVSQFVHCMTTHNYLSSCDFFGNDFQWWSKNKQIFGPIVSEASSTYAPLADITSCRCFA